MDIQQWLERTADREPPDPADDIGIPEQLLNDRPAPNQAVRSYRHKRKHAASDSSIIRPQQSYRPKTQTRAQSSSPDFVRHKRVLQDHESSNDSQSRHISVPDKAYERRARHKTRADRYVPKARKQNREPEKRKEGGARRKRRKSQRNGDGSRTAGLVQSFQLIKGPKNNRLTLKPDISAGLFKHGRASVQMAGRGTGLPDLVFNEMRFLQKPIEHQDEVRGVEESRKSKTKDPARDHGQDISAYFDAKTSLIPDPQNGHHVEQAQAAKGDDRSPRGKPSNETSLSQSLVDLPEKPFLGLGSKGAQPLSNAHHNDSASEYTWSESAQRRCSPHFVHQARAPANDRRQDLAQHPRENRRYMTGKRGRNPSKEDETSMARLNADTNQGRWIPTGRARGSAIVEVYQPPEPPKRLRHGTASITKYTSQSLPRHPSSPPIFNQRVSKDRVAKASKSSTYHTSDILDIRGQPLPSVHTFRPARFPEHVLQDKENHDPQSSLSIDKVIRKARAAAQTTHFELQPVVQAKQADIRNVPNIRNMPSINELSRQNEVHVSAALQRSDTKERNTPVHNQARWVPALTHRPISIAERRNWEAATIEALTHTAPQMQQIHQPAYLNSSDRMANDVAGTEALGTQTDCEFLCHHYKDDAIDHELFSTPAGMSEAQLDAPDRDIPDPPLQYKNLMENMSGPTRGISIENEMYGKMPHDWQDSAVEDNLAGFWKPNVLY